MDIVERNKAMQYVTRPYGFIRVLPESHIDMYIHDVLTHEYNRGWWRRMVVEKYCWLVGHIPSSNYIATGYHKYLGTFECTWCVRCRKSYNLYLANEDQIFDKLGT